VEHPPDFPCFTVCAAGENILLHARTGEVMHVDFSCLFDRYALQNSLFLFHGFMNTLRNFERFHFYCCTFMLPQPRAGEGKIHFRILFSGG